MNKYKEVIFNLETGETVERPYSAEEIAEIEAAEAKIAAEVAEVEAKEAARQAVLDKLGLTAQDLEALGL
jgi:nitrite reductase/ring-hydroxylating ferredoxin subunit